MQFIKLESREQFDQLQKNDILIVKWKERAKEYREGNAITHNSIWGINDINEVILNRRTNSYFNINMYLNGESYAEEVYLVKE